MEQYNVARFPARASTLLQQDLYFCIFSWGQQVVCGLCSDHLKLENPEV